ncbi:MAG: rod shape-determining protein MreD [Bacteroidales bacterium]|jgi:hypothetical protein|nr:rod shape-determining protein MreD [Bacteroidales bacterium]
MKSVYINNIIRTILLVVGQLFIFNNIHLTNYAVPVIYVYAVLKFPVEMSRMSILWISFLTGALVDLCMGAYGVNAAATTFIAFLRPYIGRLSFKEADEGREATPSIREFGFFPFFGYISILTTIHVAVILMIEAFPLSDFFDTLLRILLSALFSITFIILIELIFQPAHTKRIKY